MQTDMTKGNPLSIILRFMLPLMVGNIFQQLYNMADTIIVGRTVGQSALAAVGSTGTIMFLMQGFSIGLTTGFTVLTSQAFGAGNEKRTRRSVANAILLSLITAASVTFIFVVFMHQILHLMNTPADIYHDAYSYISTIAWGLVCCIAYNLGSAFLRAVGNSRVPLFTLVFSAVLNVFLDLICILVFGMGVRGAAVATNISQAVSAVLCFGYIYKKVKVLVPHKGEWFIGHSESAAQLHVGLPMALQFAITASGTMVQQSAINAFGSVAVAAFTSASKFQNMMTQSMVALGQTISTYCGQNFGAGSLKRIRAGVKAAGIMSTVFSIIEGLIVWFVTPYTLGLFFDASTNIDELLPWAMPYIGFCVVCYIPLSLLFIFRNAMQGCGYGILPMIGGVTELVARLAMSVLAIHTGIYRFAAASDPSAWVVAAVFTLFAYLWVVKDIVRKHPQMEGEPAPLL